MLVADIETLVSETLIDNEEFQEDFCAGCEAVTTEEGYRYCPCDFTPSDEDCWRCKDWGRIAAQINKLADLAGTDRD